MPHATGLTGSNTLLTSMSNEMSSICEAVQALTALNLLGPNDLASIRTTLTTEAHRLHRELYGAAGVSAPLSDEEAMTTGQLLQYCSTRVQELVDISDPPLSQPEIDQIFNGLRAVKQTMWGMLTRAERLRDHIRLREPQWSDRVMQLSRQDRADIERLRDAGHWAHLLAPDNNNNSEEALPPSPFPSP